MCANLINVLRNYLSKLFSDSIFNKLSFQCRKFIGLAKAMGIGKNYYATLTTDMGTVYDRRKIAIVCSREDIVSLSCALRPLSLSLGYIAKRVGTGNMYLLEFFVAFLFFFASSSLAEREPHVYDYSYLHHM